MTAQNNVETIVSTHKNDIKKLRTDLNDLKRDEKKRMRIFNVEYTKLIKKREKFNAEIQIQTKAKRYLELLEIKIEKLKEILTAQENENNDSNIKIKLKTKPKSKRRSNENTDIVIINDNNEYDRTNYNTRKVIIESESHTDEIDYKHDKKKQKLSKTSSNVKNEDNDKTKNDYSDITILNNVDIINNTSIICPYKTKQECDKFFNNKQHLLNHIR